MSKWDFNCKHKKCIENLMTEMPGWDFEKVKKDAEENGKELSKIKIETNDLKKKNFLHCYVSTFDCS